MYPRIYDKLHISSILRVVPMRGVLVIVCACGASLAYKEYGSIISLAVMGLWFAWHLFDISNGNAGFRMLTITKIWFLTYVPMILVPGIIIAWSKEGNARNEFLFSIISVLYTVPLGAAGISVALGFRQGEVQRFFKSPMAPVNARGRLLLVLLVGLVIAIALSVNYVRDAKSIPLLVLLKYPGEYALLREMREESFKLLDSPLRYAYYVLRVCIYPFLVLLSMGWAIMEKRRRIWVLFALCTLGAVIFGSLSTAKQPVAEIMLVIMLMIIVLYYNRVGILKLIGGAACVLGFPIMVVMLLQFGSGNGIVYALIAIGNRLFYIPSYVLYHYYEVFPGQVGFLYGRTISKLAGILGEECINAPNIVYQYIYPSRIESGLANAAFMGNAWADFGYLGVIVSGILAGAIMQGLQIMICRSHKTIYDVSAYAFMLFGFWLINSTALPTVLLSNGVIIVLLLREALNRMDSTVLQPGSSVE